MSVITKYYHGNFEDPWDDPIFDRYDGYGTHSIKSDTQMGECEIIIKCGMDCRCIGCEKEAFILCPECYKKLTQKKTLKRKLKKLSD
jgi:hypothetical protein